MRTYRSGSGLDFRFVIKLTDGVYFVLRIFRDNYFYMSVTDTLGRAMAQAVSRRPLAAEARVRSRLRPCGICGGQSGTGTGFFPSTSVFSCQLLSTGAPLQGKTKKSNHLHHRVAQ